MATQIDLARGWMQKGESDRLTADRKVQSPGPYDTACFHAQQAVEKYLNAVIALAGSPLNLGCALKRCTRSWPGPDAWPCA